MEKFFIGGLEGAGAPSKPEFLVMDVPENIESINGPVRVVLFREQPAHRFSELPPVHGKDRKGIFGKDGKTGGSVLGVRNMNPHVGPADVSIAEVAEFTNAQP